MSHRMERRNAILKQRMDARAKWRKEMDIMMLHYSTYKALAPTHAFNPHALLWRMTQEAA